MLFACLLSVKSGTAKERIARRAGWNYPDGIKVVGEWWLQTPHPAVVIICEADSIAPIMASVVDWDDVFNITVVPAVSAEEGLQLAQQMAQG